MAQKVGDVFLDLEKRVSLRHKTIAMTYIERIKELTRNIPSELVDFS